MKNVALTGVSGYLGTILLKRLIQEPGVERIIGLDVKPPPSPPEKFTFIRHDVRLPFADIFAANRIDTAIHLAFIVLPIHDAQKTAQINIEGSRNFLDACAGAGVRRVFYMGSNTEYGAFKNNSGAFTEASPLRPNKDYPYAVDKARVDLMFQDFSSQDPEICVTIGRTAPVTGPSGDACGLTAMFLPVMVKALSADPPWQFIHEDDLAELVFLLLKNEKRGIFNLAADGAVAYSQMIKQLGRPSLSLPAWLLYLGTHLSWLLRLQSRSQAGALAMLRYPIIMDNDKVKLVTGYSFRHTAPEAFFSFLQCSKKNK